VATKENGDSTTKPAGSRSTQSRFLPLRIALLATLLFGLNEWTVRHLGTGLREFAYVNSFLAFVAVVLGWIDVRDSEDLRSGLSRILRRTVDGPVLAALYLVTIAGTSLVSSVTVIADGRVSDPKLILTSEGVQRCEDCSGKVLKGPNGVVRFVRFTSVFGRPYYLEATGYQRKAFTLYPWSGETISLSADLVRLPTIVLRIPHVLHGSLRGGKIVLDIGSNGGNFEIPMQAGRASVQLGPPAAIPEGWRSEWRSELRTLANAPDALREQFYRNWLMPVRNEAIPAIAPMQQIQVSYVTAGNKEVIQQDLVIGWESLQDVVLIPKE